LKDAAESARDAIPDRSFQTVAAIAAMTSLPLAAGNLGAMLLAAHFDLRAMSDPLLLLRTGAGAAEIWRWSMVLDLFGYYLLIVPLVVGLRGYIRHKSPQWIDLCALCLLGYSLVGAMGAAVIATTTPRLIAEYSSASAGQRALLEAVSTAYADAIYRGLWNLLEELFAGVGWIVLGALMRGERFGLGIITIVLGASCLIDFLGTLLGVDALAFPGLALYLFLAPAWAFWTGTLLLRRVRPFLAATLREAT
jgi:hypothetical protein